MQTVWIHWGAAIAQLIRLRLPSCRPRFESQHTIYAFFIYSIFVIWKEQKEAGFDPFLKNIVNTLGRGGDGQVVSVLAFYSDDPSRNPAKIV